MTARAPLASLTALTMTALAIALAAAPPARAAGKDGRGPADPVRGYWAESGWAESGEASYYARAFEGRRTTSGTPYDPGRMTAAHPDLPLGTKVRVTSERTGRSVVVTVNDRQPPHGVRVIDLSREAAARLGFLRSGTAMVDLSIVRPGEDNGAVEVAEAPDVPAPDALTPSPHGRPHTRRASRSAGASRPSYRAPSATPAPR